MANVCNMVVATLTSELHIQFPQYPQLPSRFKIVCEEEAFDEIEILLDDLADGFKESLICESIGKHIKINDKDKERLCTAMHTSVSTFPPDQASKPTQDMKCSDDETAVIAPEKAKHRIKFNINVLPDKLKWIQQQLQVQCPDLLIGRKGAQLTDIDLAMCSILQIGKQNGSMPILMWLVDSYNRFRIQRRTKCNINYPDHVVFESKLRDLSADKFINSKCTGFRQWLIEHTDTQQKHFQDICQASINVLCGRLLPKIPIKNNQLTAVIDDSIIQISFYIFQCYHFIEQFSSQQNSPLPAQIDLVFVTKKYKMIDDDCDDIKSEHSDIDSDDKDDIPNAVIIGDIEKRLKTQNHVDGRQIEWRKANRIMLQNANSLIRNKHNERAVLIIDRRKQKDMLYAYQPSKDKNCHCFETDESKFLCEGLIQNSRRCILPSFDKNGVDIGINHNVNPSCLTLSFHCLSSNEIRVYLFYNGFGSRFFIQDIKYFLPFFFVKNQLNLLRCIFEQDMNGDFKNDYDKCKLRCQDPKFERFYKGLVNGKEPYGSTRQC